MTSELKLQLRLKVIFLCFKNIAMYKHLYLSKVTNDEYECITLFISHQLWYLIVNFCAYQPACYVQNVLLTRRKQNLSSSCSCNSAIQTLNWILLLFLTMPPFPIALELIDLQLESCNLIMQWVFMSHLICNTYRLLQIAKLPNQEMCTAKLPMQLDFVWISRVPKL